MIGVIAKSGQEGVVEEFFQLFKTPWEWYRPGQRYDVVLSTSDEVPEVNPRLLLLFGAELKTFDTQIGISVRECRGRSVLNATDCPIPVYDRFLTFVNTGGISCVNGKLGVSGIKFNLGESTVIRIGYDLFEQVRLLLSEGQPVENAQMPALDNHIRVLRNWILEAGISLLEIPASPHGHSFSVCLTHDIDFVGIRHHFVDRTMCGFVYRATLGAVRNFFRGRISAIQLLKSWWAVVTLPFVYLGWKEDFWEPFGWYAEVEKGLPATYFLIPFKGRPGEKVTGPKASLRATAYDVRELASEIEALQKQGCEIGVHGIDAWHNPEKGREELERIQTLAPAASGVRMHWLLRGLQTPRALEEAGYEYDSTCGYNETIGYRNGTSRVFLPSGAQNLLELPMHIQDGALFYGEKLDLSPAEARTRCEAIIDHVRAFGGVLTLLWHDRSHAAERFWGGFYSELLQQVKAERPWFATAGQVVSWFRRRRQIEFQRVGTDRSQVRVNYDGEEIHPAVTLRIYHPKNEVTGASQRTPQFTDFLWNGSRYRELDLDTSCNSNPDSILCSLP